MIFLDFNVCDGTLYRHIVAIMSSNFSRFFFCCQLLVQDKLSVTNNVTILIICCEKIRFIAIEAGGGH